MIQLKYLFVSMYLGIIISGCSDRSHFLDQKYSVEERVENLISQMTLEEKISMLHANSKFTVGGIERLGIPAWAMSDGPHGVREEIQAHSWGAAGWTTDSASYFPTGTALSSTWNTTLAYQFGQALGSEARARNKDVILGPGINIMRSPLCGRNFEYMGEDPYLISKLSVPYIRGVQEQDVAACLKHFALNNQEYERDIVNVEISERALREIYLPGYEAAVKEGRVLTVMAGYNKVRGAWCAENNFLLNELLKNSWGFRGTVMSDWNGTHSTLASALSGLDVEMGTNVEKYQDYYFAEPLLTNVQSGIIAEQVIEDKVRRVLRVMFESKIFDTDRVKGSFSTKEHSEIAHKVGQQAVVLLKNKHQLLPLNKGEIKSMAVIGDNATRRHAAGGGSSGLKARYEVTPIEGLRNKFDDTVQIHFAQGYKVTTSFSWNNGVVDTFNVAKAAVLRREAVEAARQSDVAVIFAGLNHHFDTEGADRKDMKLPYHQDQLIKEVAAVNPNTILVLISGSPVEMPWVEEVNAILQGWYNGMETGNILAEILLGEINPSGKLSFTFPAKLQDSPAHYNNNYPGINHTVHYEEGILVGYRWFDTKNIEPLFCFGHGLSYTQFEYSDLKIDSSQITPEQDLHVTVKVKNSGQQTGYETVQLYVQDLQASVIRPEKELKGFEKVLLKPGEIKEVAFNLDEAAFSFYDSETGQWQKEAGAFRIHAGSSSRDIRLSGDFELIQ